MRTVSAIEVGREVITLLDLKDHSVFEITKTKDGRVIISRAET